MLKNYLLSIFLLCFLALESSADKATERVAEHLENGEISLALKEAQRLVKKQPRNYQYLYQLIALEHTQREYSKVIDLCIKLDKIKTAKPRNTAKAADDIPPFAYIGETKDYNVNLRLRFIPKAPSYYQHVYYSKKINNLILASLRSFQKVYNGRNKVNLYILKPNTLQQAKNLSYHHLASIYDIISKDPDYPKSHLLRKKIRTLPAAEYLVEHHGSIDNYIIAEVLQTDSPLTNTPSKRLSTFLLAKPVSLDKEQLHQAIKLTAKRLPLENMRMRVQLKIKDSKPDDVFALLEKSKLSHEQQATLLLENAKFLSKEKFTTAILKYHKLIKNKQSLTRHHLERKWIEINRNTESKELLADIHFLLKEGNSTPFKEQRSARFRNHYNDYRWLSTLLTTLPDNLYQYLSSRNTEDLKNLLPHFNEINSAAVQFFILTQIRDHKKITALLQNEIKLAPNSLDLRFLAISNILSSKEQSKDRAIKILPHLEAIYAHQLSEPLRSMIDKFSVEQLESIYSTQTLKEKFKPKAYQQEVVRRSIKSSDYLQNSIFYEMMGMKREYLKLKEKSDLEKQRLRVAKAKQNRNINKEFIENLKKGNQTFALKTAANDIWNVLRTDSDYAATTLYKEAKKKKLDEKLTLLLRPKKSDAIYQWIKFHHFMEKCGAIEAAKLASKNLQQQKSIPLQYRIQVAMILMVDYTESALDILQSLPNDMLSYLPSEFSSCLRKKSLLGQRRLQFLKGFLTYLKYFYENKSHIVTHPNWANPFYTLASFTEPGVPAYDSSDEKPPATPYSRSRDKVINAIAKELMLYPYIADQIFKTYVQKNNPPDEEIMELCAMILLQKTQQLEAKHYTAQLSTQTYPRVLSTTYDYTIHYLITQPEKASQHYGNELIHFLKTKKQDNKDYQKIPFLLHLAKEKDPKLLTNIIAQCYLESDNNELIFLSHYNPLIIKEYTRQYFSHIDQFIKAVETDIAKAKEKKPTDKRFDEKILYSLRVATPIVSSYLRDTNQTERWQEFIIRLFKADPLTIHPLTDFNRDRIDNDILPLLKLTVSKQSTQHSLFLLNLSKDYPGLLPLVRLERNFPPQQILSQFKGLKLLAKTEDIDFNLLSPTQQALWNQYLSLPNKSRNSSKYAKHSLYLHLAHHYKYDLKSHAQELSKHPELAVSLFCFKACILSESPEDLLDYLQENTQLFQQLDKQQKADFISSLGLDNSLSSQLVKRPELMKKLGISPTQIAKKFIKNAKQFLSIKSLDDPQDQLIATRDQHLMKNLAHIDPVLAAKVTLKQIDLYCQSQRAIKKYPNAKHRIRRAHENYTPYRDTPQNFIQSVLYQAELLTHPSASLFGEYYKIKYGELEKQLNHIHARQGKKTEPKDHIPYLKKLIKEFDQIPGKQRQENLRLCLIYSFDKNNFLCDLIPPVLKELEINDPAFISQHKDLTLFIEQACKYVNYLSDYHIPTQPFQINHLRTKPALLPDTSDYLDKPTPLKLLSQLSNKDLHLSYLNTIYLRNYHRSKLLIPLSISIIERLEDPDQVLDYRNLLNQLALNHQNKPSQELVSLARRLLTQIKYLKSFRGSQSLSYQYLTFIATNGESTDKNIAFTKLLLEKNPALRNQLYYQLKSIQYDLPVSHPIQFSEYHSDKFFLDFRYTRKLEKALSKVDISLLTKKELFHLYRATAYLNDDLSEIHLIESDQQARMKRLAAIIHKKYISHNYAIHQQTIKYLSQHSSIDTARALLPYLKEKQGNAKLFDKATFKRDHRYSTTLHYALAIYDLQHNELNSSIDRLFPAKPHYHVYGDYTKALVNGATIAALECIHSRDHQRLKKLLPALRRILNLELRQWKPERTQSNLMNLNHYCHPHIMKTVELAHILCNASADYAKLKATFTTDLEKKAWEACQRYTVNQFGNYYLNQSPEVYQAFLTKLPSAFGKDNPYYRNWHLRHQSYFSPKQMIEIVNQHNPTRPNTLHLKHLHLAHLHEIIGNKPTALHHWNQLINLVKQHHPEQLINYQLQQVNAVYHLQNPTSALKLLEQIHPRTQRNNQLKETYFTSLQKAKNAEGL